MGRIDPVSSALCWAVLPASVPLTRACDATGEFLYGVARARSLAIENRELRDRNSLVALYQPEIDLLNQRLDVLRKQVGLPSLPGHQRVSLDVIGFAQTEGQLVLDGGTELGIQPDMPVVNGEGLAGFVQAVSHGKCWVTLLTAYGVSFGGSDVSRKPPELGLLRGRGSSTIPMTMFDPKAPVNSGDLVVTSGLSAHIPAGIPIGRVISVEDDMDYGTKSATIDPAVNIGTLKEVQVLK